MCGENEGQNSETIGRRRGGRRALARLALAWLLVVLSGCATRPLTPSAQTRQFDFQKDTFAFPNELVWEYRYDAEGHWRTQRRTPKPEYALHCFVLARATAQFFENAQFDPGQPVADERTYRHLVHRMTSANPRHPAPDTKRIVVPGYANLREFSQARESLLKAECGGVWQCYFQRGNWRMIFPFSRRRESREAEYLLKRLAAGELPIVHLVRFPQLSINHVVVVLGARQTGEQTEFETYDPNQPSEPVMLLYQSSTRTFSLRPNSYFPGGRVDVYQIYWKWDY